MMMKSYNELITIPTFEERFVILKSMGLLVIKLLDTIGI